MDFRRESDVFKSRERRGYSDDPPCETFLSHADLRWIWVLFEESTETWRHHQTIADLAVAFGYRPVNSGLTGTFTPLYERLHWRTAAASPRRSGAERSPLGMATEPGTTHAAPPLHAAGTAQRGVPVRLKVSVHRRV